MDSLDEKKFKKKWGIPANGAFDASDIKAGDELTLTQCVLEKSDFSNSSHKSSHIKQCEFVSINLLSADFSESKFDRVFVDSSRLSGMSLAGSLLIDVVFNKCKINRSSFRGARLKRVIFNECDLTDADFQSAELDRVVFRSCELAEADYSQAIMKIVDVRGSRLGGAKFGYEQLKELTIDQSQATYIALLMGVNID